MMRNCLLRRLLTLTALLLLASCSPTEAKCPPTDGIALQVLGSGGPIADDARASSGYLLWIDGTARVLIDAGGGTFLRFAEAGARFEDLNWVGLSHVHADHSADFPALLKSGNFSGRQRPLPIAGPAGEGQFPGLKTWLRRIFHRESGAYAYLAGFLDGTSGVPMLISREIDGSDAAVVYRDDLVQVEAMRVPHGIVPAAAFKVTTKGQSFVFGTDQNGSNGDFADFATGASILVMHMVIPESTSGVARRLHAPPSVIGRIAAAAGAGKLVLSHFMARSLRDLDKNVELVRSSYGGDIVLAEDLLCVLP
jgi:ribonuclease BN (tRNA processing enzyme)